MNCMSFRVNVFIIFDLLFESDSKSSSRIFDAINDSINALDSKLECRITKCNNQIDFFNEIEKIKKEITHNDLYPFIHVDGHGSDDGNNLIFPDESSLDYKFISRSFREINILCNNNLFVTSGACNFAFVLKEDISIKIPCPIFGILAPEKIVYDKTMEKGFIAFFNTFIQSNGNIYKANLAFRNEVNGKDYALIFAEDLINNAIKSSILETSSGKQKKIFRENLLTKCMNDTNIGFGVLDTRNLIKKRQKDIPKSLTKYKLVFLMINSCSENKERFNQNI